MTKPDTVLLANGMRAVVSMEEDAPETQAATRATMDDGHYTIFALDPATGDRITGTKKQLTGTVTGGVFQSDAGSEMILDPGTYKFVCINDAVTDHGTSLQVHEQRYRNGSNGFRRTDWHIHRDHRWRRLAGDFLDEASECALSFALGGLHQSVRKRCRRDRG